MDNHHVTLFTIPILTCFCLTVSPFSLLWLTSHFLTPKPGKWRFALRCMAFLIAIYAVIFIADPINILYTFPFFALGIFKLYTENWQAKLAMIFVLYPFIMSVNALIDNIPLLFYLSYLWRLIFWAVFWLIARRLLTKTRYSLSPHLWQLVAALACLPMCAVFSIIMFSEDRVNYSTADYTLTVQQGYIVIGFFILPFVLFCSLVLLYSITVLHRHEQIEQENQLYQMRALYWKNIEQDQLQIRRLRHDMANHLTALSGFLDTGDTEQAKEYLHGLQNTASVQAKQYCRHPAANAVLSAKAAAAEATGLMLEISADLPEKLPLSNLDIAALIGNAADNALEAAQSAADKHITLQVKVYKGVFMLRVQNAYGAPRKQADGAFLTTKPDTRAHGFGLKTMGQIVARYGGEIDARAENGRFDFVAVIPLGGAAQAF